MKKIIALLLAVAMLFAFAACGKDDNLTTNKVLKVAEKLGDGKEVDVSAFDGYACEVSENVYKTYTYTIDDNTMVIVTTDKKTGETKEMYIFRGGHYINLKEGRDAVEKWLEETDANDTIETSKVDKIKRTTTKKETTTTTTQAFQNTTAAAGTTAGTTAATTGTTAATTAAPETTAATTVAPETTTAAAQ